MTDQFGWPETVVSSKDEGEDTEQRTRGTTGTRETRGQESRSGSRMIVDVWRQEEARGGAIPRA